VTVPVPGTVTRPWRECAGSETKVASDDRPRSGPSAQRTGGGGGGNREVPPTLETKVASDDHPLYLVRSFADLQDLLVAVEA
jgi:hypothetical protein